MSTPVGNRSSAGSGLGISFASLSPPTVSTTQVSTGFTASPSRTAQDSPTRPSHHRGQHQPPLALRPTHHRGQSSKGFASFSALPPTPSRASPARQRLEGSTSSRGSDRTERREEQGLSRNLSNASTATAGSRIRKSRSSELLRRLSRNETVSGGKYVPLSGEDGESSPPPARSTPTRKRSDTVSTVSVNPAQSPQTHDPTPSDSQHSFMPASFPAPPHRPLPHPVMARSLSQPQNMHHAGGSDPRLHSPTGDSKRISDPSTGIHSQNQALFDAERGGKMLAYSADGVWCANSIASGTPVGSVARQLPHLPQHPASGSEEDLRRRPWSDSTNNHRPPHVRSLSEGSSLLRHGTLLHPQSGGDRASTELGIMLGNKSRKLSQGKLLPPPELEAWQAVGGAADKVKLEAAKKRRARVEVDVVTERECVVEGGEVRGRLEIRVNGGKSEGLRVGGGKVRVVGYEDISAKSRHIFYHHPYSLPLFAHPPHPNGPQSSLFASGPDSDGFYEAQPGTHWIPFCMRLPLNGGAKGSYTSTSPQGPSVRYVVVGSVKLLHPRTGKRSIAHFYRPIVVLPYLNPGVVLAPCEEMVEVIERRELGWSLGGAKGMVELRIALGRSVWVSGQRVWCEIGVRNDSTKKIKSLTLALLQTVQTFLPDNDTAAVSTDKDGIPNADEALGIASTVRRKVTEESIVADDQDYGSGRVTGRRWWTGVDAGEMGGWDLSLLIPNGMISIPRSRLIEVTYTLRLTANASTNLFVDVPLTLVNFLSIDPPPMPGDGARYGMSQSQMSSAQMPVASTMPYGTSIRSGESITHAAVASSTTLHIDALLSAGRARAEAEAAAHYPPRDARPMSMGSDYTPDVFGAAQIGAPLGWPNRSPMTSTAGGAPGRPKNPRVMSYLSARSSNFEHDHTLSENDADQEEPDEADRLLLAAARREGRKMSLAALTRAADRERDDYAQGNDPEGMISPMRETPPTGMWLPAETPYEEVFKVLGETPSTHSGNGNINSPVPVPTIGKRRKESRSESSRDRDEDAEEMRRLERGTIAEEQEAMASTRGSSDDNHTFEDDQEQSDGGGGYAEQDFRPAPQHQDLAGEDQGEYGGRPGRRSHESIPEEEEPEDEDMDIGNETILEDMVPHEDDTLRMTLPPSHNQEDHHPAHPGQHTHSPDPATTSLGSLGSGTGTGHTSSSLRVPSRSGSALENQIIRSVDSEREAYIQQTRSVYGSFAASAISEVESEVGQVVQAVKRNLSIKTPSKTMDYSARPGVEEMDEDKLSPTRALAPRAGSMPFGILRKSSHTPSPVERQGGGGDATGGSPKQQARFGSAPNIQGYGMKREHSAPSAPSPLRDQVPSRDRVFANRPSFSFNAPASLQPQTREASLSPRGGSYSLSPGPSPRSAFPTTLGAPESMHRVGSAQSQSQLRNQLALRPSSIGSSEHDNEHVPGLAPSVASDSASSEGHEVESPAIHAEPNALDAVVLKHTSLDSAEQAHTQAAIRGHAQAHISPAVEIKSSTSKNFAPVLDPNWLPGEHHLSTHVAYARTSFSAPAPDGALLAAATATRRPSIAAMAANAMTESPQRSRRKDSRAGPKSTGDHSVYSHDGETYYSHGHEYSPGGHAHGSGPARPQSTKSGPTSPTVSSHSSHAPMLTGMQTRLKQLEARDEALRKFSVASAASGGYDRDRAPSVPRLSNAHSHAHDHLHEDAATRRTSETREKEQVVRKRRSYTAALGSRPVRSTSDDVIDKPTSSASALGGTSYITRRPFGTSPPVAIEDSRGAREGGWYSPPRLELSFSPPARSVSELRRNMSSSSVSTTATSMEAALLRRPAGPRQPLPAPPSLGAMIGRHAQPDVDPYDSLGASSRGSGTSHVYSPAMQSRATQDQGRRGDVDKAGSIARSRSRADYLQPDAAYEYGPESYGSEAGSVVSKSGLSREWAPPQRSWAPRGSTATDESEGLR